MCWHRRSHWIHILTVNVVLLLYSNSVISQDICPCTDAVCIGTSCSCYSELSVTSSNKGTSFVFMFMENGAPDIYNLEVVVSSASDVTTEITLHTPVGDSGFVSRHTLQPGQVVRLPISHTMVHVGSNIRDKAVLLTSSHYVTVYALNRKGFSSDGFLVLPEIVLDLEYYVVSFYEPKYWQQFGMVSTQDSTLVQVTIPRPEGTPAIPCNIRWKEHTYLFGDTIKIEMDAYQTAQIQGNNGNPNTGYWESAEKYDLSGIHIKSNKPIAVFSGNYRTSIPSGKASRDHIVEQLVPTSSWGQHYVMLLIDEREREWENYYSITALYHNSVVQFRNGTNTSLNAGETVHSSFTESQQLKSSHPVQVAQYTPSSPVANRRGNESDPSMIILPSVSNWHSEYIFATPSAESEEKFTDHAYIAIEKGAQNELTLNEQSVSDVTWHDLPGDIDMVWGVMVLPHGEFTIRQQDNVTFMCVLFGYEDRESYGFSAGGVYARTGFQLMRPSMDYMYPAIAYGPESGGTYMSFHGNHLAGINSVMMTQSNDNDTETQHCTVLVDKSNHTVLSCMTAPSHHMGVFNISLEQLFVSDVNDSYTCSLIYQTAEQFEYKKDPVVLSLEPNPPKTIKEGGIQVDIIGKYMDSVKHPLFIVNEYDANTNVTSVFTDVSKPCELMSNKLIRCYTPPIPVSTSGVVKRSVEDTAQDTDYFNSQSREYYLGLLLDGLDTYQDLRNVIGPDAKLMVAKDAMLDPFDDDPLIYDVTKRSTLLIEGRRLNSGATIKDFSVHIGHTECIVTELGYNYLVCEPPYEQPENRVDSNSDTVPVDVTIGFRSGIRLGNMIWAKEKENTQVWVITVIAIVAFLSVCVVITIIVSLRCRQGSGKTRSKNDMLKKIRSDLRSRVMPFLIPKNLLDRGSQIGQGHFGVVYKGTLFNGRTNRYSSVAIKGFGANSYTVRDVEGFLSEAVKLQGMEHANLLTVLGVVIEDNKPYMVLPLMDHGDMKSFLAQPEQKLTVGDLVFFGFQVCVGMAFLEQNKVIHADLAARNCMIDKNFIVKVADFGLSKILSNTEDYYTVNKNSQPLPVKWLALECLTQGKLSSKSDVWSFGVLLWEFMTRGQNPYPDITNSEVKEYLRRGCRMSQPDYCPDPIYDVMQRCWFANTDYRPTFSELKNELSELLSVASDNLYIRNVTQELPYTYYLNEEYLLLPKQFVCENAYVKLMSDEAGYMNDGFDRRYSEAMTSRKLSTGQGGIPASKINASTAF